MSKIFGIGMPKTGTSSLHRALQILGFNSVHFVRNKKTFEEVKRGQYRLSILEEYDALSDIPIPAIFAQLDHCWSDSKFILTERQLDRWLESCRNARFNHIEEVPDPSHFRFFYRTLLYGCINFNEERFSWVYETHSKLVRDHFSGDKASQLLILNICDGDGWEKLCPFLGVPQPDCEFPHANKRKVGSS